MGARSTVEAALGETQGFIEETLDRLLPLPDGPESRLLEAMRYAVLGGGKRIRAFMTLQTAVLFNVDEGAAARAAAAIECLHAYSLVHDDLPCMDDDDLRRGRPTLHRAYDEATAVLAGDALQAFAFGLLADGDIHADPFVRAELVARFAQAVGPLGMVGGQMIDIATEGTDPDIATITRLQRLKTGALIAFSCEAGAILGKAGAPERHALAGYAQDLGLAFQITDDLLDAEGDPEAMGKAAGGKDAARGKTNFVTILGLDRARQQAAMLAEQAVAHLEIFDARADLLRGLVDLVVERGA
ncbi:Farnesyl diphosphate synthase [Alphaproteobacteria bacterium SO-S41]|nr:Farnesyl diphosphate synthase [Alphaproteobacteria bacterium SO-S41]